MRHVAGRASQFAPALALFKQDFQSGGLALERATQATNKFASYRQALSFGSDVRTFRFHAASRESERKKYTPRNARTADS